MTVPPAATHPDTASAAPALPALTEEERAIADRLRVTVQHLAVEIGDRSTEQSWNVASATDDLATSLEKTGYDVQRQGIVAGDTVVQNIVAHVSGGEHGSQVIVVGAHFDTAQGTPGADDDASGVAAVMELARTFQSKKGKRALHLAFFANGEAPYLGTEHMGSLVYAKWLKTQGLDVKAMLSLDGIGVYADAPPARAYPAGVTPAYPAASNFVAIAANDASRPLLEQVTASMQHGSVPVIGGVLAEDHELAQGSDQWAFWKLGAPALLVTDLAQYRYGDYHQKTDLPDNLDFERLARIVSALKKTVAELVDG
ncbi:MAG TPA: M28 family peptidase [Polyangiaceae bacterium]|nr:M28 family peptidase [Polyangiaceae bacterium]